MSRLIHAGWIHGWSGAARLAVALLAAAQIVVASAHADTIRVETLDGTRSAILLPADRQPAPTVIVLHGAVNSAEWAVRRFGFAEAAAARGFAAVFPQSIGLQWNDGRGGVAARADDVGFLRQLAVELVERGVAEPRRIYIAGISNGGMMALRMVCESAEMLAGVGTVIASLPAATGATCRPRRPVPIVMFNGTADGLVPYHGGGLGVLNLGALVWGAERTAAFLAEANRCSNAPLASDALFGKISVTRIAWSGCADNAAVMLYRVNGGRHQVLGRNRLLGGRKDELSAAETILSEFAGDDARL